MRITVDMAERGYTLTQQDMLRLTRALRKVEQYLPDEPIKETPGDPPFRQDVLFARVTSLTTTSSRYPGLLVWYTPTDTAGSRWSDDTQAIWIEAANGETLETSKRYQVALRGYDQGRYVYVVDDVGASSGIVAGDLNGYRQAGTTVDVYYPGGNITGGFLTYYTAKDLIHCVSFIVPNTITLDEIAVWLQTNGAAGKKCRLAIYDSPSQTDIFPDQLIVDSGEIAIDSGAAGYKTASINVTLTGGKNYWLCYVSNDNVGTLGGTNQTFMSPIFGMSKTSFAEKFGLITTFTYAAFPSTYPGTASDLSGGPFIIPVVHLSG